MADFTYQDIMKWSFKEMRDRRKDPVQAAEIDAVLAAHTAAKAQTDPATAAELAAKTAQQEQARATAAANEAARAEAEKAEQIRLRMLSPAEQEQEMIKRAAEQKFRESEAEKEATRSQVAAEKERLYLSGADLGDMLPAERNAIIRERHQKVQDDAAAAEAAQDAAEVAAKEAAEKVVADALQAEADKKAADEKAAADTVLIAAKAQEELALLEKAKIVAEEAAKLPKQKIVREYQAKDENGNPIGRPTRLVADTWEEMSQLQEDAHVNALRYAERMKKRASFKPSPAVTEKPIPVLSDEERAALQKQVDSKNQTEAELAKTKLDLDEVQKERAAKRKADEHERQRLDSNKFVAAHSKDFYPCEANARALGTYLTEHNLSWTADNLEIAFDAIGESLAVNPATPLPVETAEEIAAKTAAEVAAKLAAEEAVKEAAKQTISPSEGATVSPEQIRAALLAEITTKVKAEFEAQRKIEQEQTAANTAAAAASVVASEVTQVVAPAAPTPEEIALAAANTAAAARKLPAGGIEPGSLHGGRPTSAASSTPPALTKQDIARMPGEEMRKNLKRASFRKQLNDLGIPTPGY